ncbi:hypothetical protein PspLS_08880 [Pyricularia sp. CBS 133598]|nr:hypothetical protein PspLS_08880 [Pyricularia sp. CBS 133598]
MHPLIMSVLSYGSRLAPVPSGISLPRKEGGSWHIIFITDLGLLYFTIWFRVLGEIIKEIVVSGDFGAPVGPLYCYSGRGSNK